MAHVTPPIIFVWAERALPLARKIANALDGAEIHGPTSVDGTDKRIDQPGDHLRAIFRSGQPIVGIGAVGILVRILGACVHNKVAEPPVIAVGEDGGAVVPVLGGHHGANVISKHIAAVLGVKATTTTATDAMFGVALDDPPAGITLANPDDHKAFATALLNGSNVRVAGAQMWPALATLSLRRGEGALALTITSRQDEGSPSHLVYHPRVLAVGVGTERGAPPEKVIAFVRATLVDAGLAERAVAGMYSIDLKLDEPAVHAVAAALKVPARFFTAERLEQETPRLANPSETVYRAVGAHGVAEAAALAAAGPEAHLVVKKQRGAQATVAVAEAQLPFDGTRVGRARGRLAIVGLGPGAANWRTPEAERFIVEATDIVGYRLYLDLIGPLAANQACHRFDLGDEEARVRRALDLAGQGRSVALVCSGDAGIYAMASLVWELIDQTAVIAWRRIEVVTTPGVSALQAAAARVGAPLGNDFCAISLSDLMTPWSVIERRLRAAAEGDFVVALYNPVSRRRQAHIGRARDILLQRREPETPVVLARNLGRENEDVRVVSLASVSADNIDMLTIVVVGSSQTRTFTNHDQVSMYTPRGYAISEVESS